MNDIMKFGLHEKFIADIASVFQQYPQVNEVILYGSRAKGNFKNGSDIDLTLKGKDISLSILNGISNKLDDLNSPYTFDISIFDHIENPDLLSHIERIGMVFYSKE
jgi:uncharacterized protein